MPESRSRGSTASKPIEVRNDHLASSSLLQPGSRGTDVSETHAFSDFKLVKCQERAPLCDLFDRSTQLSELPFSIGTYPEWNRTRPFLTGAHLWNPSHSHPTMTTLTEAEWVEDLLFVFMGLGGAYLRPVFTHQIDHHQELSFQLNGGMDSSCRELLQRMIPLCEAVVVVQRFIETRSGLEYGTVCHALAAAMQDLMDDWMVLVTQLETQLRSSKLAMQTLWFYVQPAMSVIVLLGEICRQTSAQEFQGTELLNLLHSKMTQMSGSQNNEAILKKLLEAAALPYFQILEKWLCEGIIVDPYHEFMIEEDPTIQVKATTSDLQSAYWQKRYRIRKTFLSLNGEIVTVHCIPSFLHQHADMILATGKCLNAIRECGRHVDRPMDSNEHLVFDASCSYIRLIQKAHKFASRSFLDMFVNDLKLAEELKALKHFFLMDKGDMIGHLMDIAEEELEKVASQVVVNRMQSLLEMAFKTSSLSSEIHTEPLQVELDHRSLVDLSVCLRHPQKNARASMRSRQSIGLPIGRTGDSISGSHRASFLAEELMGWDIFMIRYHIEWPMMLVIPPKLMQMYQLLFKQLFVLKRTEYDLNKAWKALQKTRNLADKHLDNVLRLAQVTCYQMQHVIRQYLRYLTVHTIEPKWIAMETTLQKAKDVDDVIRIHQSFVEKILWQSLLRKVKGVKELDHVITEASNYARSVISILNVDVWSLPNNNEIADKPAELVAERRRLLNAKIESALKSSNFDQRVLRCKTDFHTKLNQWIKTLMDYCDTERGETSQRTGVDDELQSREDLEKLLDLIEMLRPRHS